MTYSKVEDRPVHPTVLQSKLLYVALVKWSNTEMQMETRESMTVGFADQSMAVKGTLYDLTKRETPRVGTTVMMMNTIILTNTKTIVITNKLKVLNTSPLANISQETGTRLGMSTTSRQSTD